jgi:pectinesterase
MLKYLMVLVTALFPVLVSSQVKYDFVVAQDGTGDFKTVQEAINAVPDYRKVATRIFIKNGRYKEKLVLPESKTLVTFIGENNEKTILTYDDYATKKNRFNEDKGTSGSASFYMYASDFTAENICFENSAGPVGQAVAAFVKGDRTVFRNCRFLGFQDTLYTYGRESRQYFKNCYIEGTVDFIFGSSTALFEDCKIFCKSPGYITAASTPENISVGYVFKNCEISSSAPVGSVYLGRPWRPYAKTVFINCYLPAQVNAAGWHVWNDNENHKTSTYAEYKNRGEGFKPESRVPWLKQLTDDQANAYSMKKIFGDWVPESRLLGAG